MAVLTASSVNIELEWDFTRSDKALKLSSKAMQVPQWSI
jgi:hypothetical protein